jgi:ABC-2 type transport system permease protein
VTVGVLVAPDERGLAALVRDGGRVAGRNLRRYRRSPASVASAVVFPLIFFFGFLSVLRRSLEALGVDYAQYLPPAVVVQAMFFTAISSAFFLADDRQRGLLERCRSLPISRWAPLVGRVEADLTRSALSITVLVLAASLAGFRFEAGLVPAVGFFGVALLFTLAAAAACSLVGLAAPSPEAANSMLFLPYLPLLMLSTAFVPAVGFPGWLQPFVRWQPVSLTADALRALSSGGPTAAPVVRAVVVLSALAVVFGALGARAYRRLGS